MKKLSFTGAFLLLSFHFAFAQFGTILPTQSDFWNNSTSDNAYAVKAVMTSTSTGWFSVAVRAQNSGTNGLGYGVWGSHASHGTGVYGTTVGGIGVHGYGLNGFGVYGTTGSGTGVHGFGGNNGTGLGASAVGGTGISASSISGKAAVFNLSEGNNSAVEITHAGLGNGLNIDLSNSSALGAGVMVINSGIGIGGRFANMNPVSAANGLEGETNGTGAAGQMLNFNSNGNGAGFVVTKTNPYSAAYSTAPNVDLDVRHPIQSTLGMTGLRILNTASNLNNWTFYTADDNGTLYLYANGVEKGQFSAATGAYTNTSDRRLKNSISNYSPTLKKLMNVDVKSYRLNGSDKTEIGLMAQDVLAYFPEIVYDNTNDKGGQFYSMDYSRIGVLAVKALQEQQVIIEKQQSEINTLKAEMAALKRLVEASLKK